MLRSTKFDWNNCDDLISTFSSNMYCIDTINLDNYIKNKWCLIKPESNLDMLYLPKRIKLVHSYVYVPWTVDCGPKSKYIRSPDVSWVRALHFLGQTL